MWAFFRRPKGLVLSAAAQNLAPGVSVLAEGDSCPIPSMSGCAHEISAVPYWLRELAFETPDNPPGKAAPVPSRSPAPCRAAAHFLKPHWGTRKDYPVSGHAGLRGGYRISRRR